MIHTTTDCAIWLVDSESVAALIGSISSVHARLGLSLLSLRSVHIWKLIFHKVVQQQLLGVVWWDFDDHFIANFLLSVPLKEFWKSVNILDQSLVSCFFDSRCTCCFSPFSCYWNNSWWSCKCREMNCLTCVCITLLSFLETAYQQFCLMCTCIVEYCRQLQFFLPYTPTVVYYSCMNSFDYSIHVWTVAVSFLYSRFH